MNAQQRTYLSQVKNISERKVRNREGVVITDIVLNVQRLEGLSESVKNRVSDELEAQGLIMVVKRRAHAVKVSITNLGLEKLNISLINAGKGSRKPSITVDEDFKTFIKELTDAVNNAQLINQELWSELLITLNEEVEKDQPKKNLIYTLLGTMYKGVGTAANIVSIAEKFGIDVSSLIQYINSI